MILVQINKLLKEYIKQFSGTRPDNPIQINKNDKEIKSLIDVKKLGYITVLTEAIDETGERYAYYSELKNSVYYYLEEIFISEINDTHFLLDIVTAVNKNDKVLKKFL
jgi:hypothetical protein